MATIPVRVIPRSSRPGVEVRDAEVVVRVQAPPVGGRATEEARRTLAGALGLPPSAVRLRSGPASRRKAFDIEGLGANEVVRRLRAGR